MSSVMNDISLYRKLLRLAVHIILMSVSLSIFITYNYLDSDSGKWFPEKHDNAKISIRAKNCQILMLKSEDFQFYTRYSVKREQYLKDNPGLLKSDYNSTLSQTVESGNYKIESYSQFDDPKWCWVEIYVP
jgi:hypothetical protein